MYRTSRDGPALPSRRDALFFEIFISFLLARSFVYLFPTLSNPVENGKSETPRPRRVMHAASTNPAVRARPSGWEAAGLAARAVRARDFSRTRAPERGFPRVAHAARARRATELAAYEIRATEFPARAGISCVRILLFGGSGFV